jgi:hypothetical protein
MFCGTFLLQLRKDILSTAINQHTPKETARCFNRFFTINELHVQSTVGVHEFYKNIEAISKTNV